MYDVTVTNDYGYLQALEHPCIKKVALLTGLWDTKAVKNQKDHILSAPHTGLINIIGITDKQLSEYTNGSLSWPLSQWGCLAGYRELDTNLRYEGEVIVEDNPHGCLDLSFTQGGMVINLADVTVN